MITNWREWLKLKIYQNRPDDHWSQKHKSPNLNSPDDSFNLQILSLSDNSLKNRFFGFKQIKKTNCSFPYKDVMLQLMVVGERVKWQVQVQP